RETACDGTPQRHQSVPFRQRVRRYDERQMHQSLRKVRQELAALGVDLFGIQANVIGQREQLIHESAGFVFPAAAGQRMCEPERTGQERPLVADEPVFSEVAVHERTSREHPTDSIDSAEAAVTSRITVAYDGEQQ